MHEPDAFERPRKAESIGRPAGNEVFLQRMAGEIGRTVKPAKRGRKAKE